MNSSYGESLGGVYEGGIETATETSIVYGKVQATAAEKQEALYTLGLCEILEMALFCRRDAECGLAGRDRAA